MRGFAGSFFVFLLFSFFEPSLISCKAVVTAPAPKERSFAAVDDFLYQLQDVNLDLIAKSRYDLAVIDYSKDGSEAEKWKSSELSAVQSKGIFLLAYLSIGEAENYRSYWQSSWRPGYPSWIGNQNPDWAGNYKVKYWDAEWRAIVKSYLAEIAAQGFDGVYLDVIDAYVYWSEAGNGESETLSIADAADKMTAFVRELADYVRKDLGKSTFIVCPQNGTEIIDHVSASASDAYLDCIDALGSEDTFCFGGDEMDNEWNPQGDVIAKLDALVSMGKKVLAVEYLSQENAAEIKRFYQTAGQKGYVPFATNRELDTFRVNTGFEPD